MSNTHASSTSAFVPSTATTKSADDLDSYTLEPAFRRLHTVVQLTCVQPANPSSVPQPHSVLLVSPPGTGKSSFVRLLSSHCRLPLIAIRPVALSPHSLSSSFEEARRKQPSLLCVDEADLLLPRTSDDETWQCTLLSCFLDQLASLSASTDRVLLILLCSTAGVLRLANAVRSAIEVTLEAYLPTAAHRLSLLQHFLLPLCASQSTAESFPFLPDIVAECGGMSGADLLALVREAAQHALSNERDTLTHSDFQAALQLVSASSASGMVTAETEVRVGWEDIVGMQQIKQELQDCLIPLLNHPTTATTTSAPSLLASLRSPPGVLLYGPPGTGKTLLAQAVSSVAGVSFLSLSLSSLLHSHIGESERALLAAFQRAQSVAPAVLFIDELDALFSATTATLTTSRLTSTLCSLLDAVHSQRLPLLLLAASNVPQLLEARLLIPSRFGSCLHVGLPPAADRVAMARRVMSEVRVVCGEGVEAIVEELTTGFTMADVRFLMGLCLRGREGSTISVADISEARSRMSGSVSVEMAESLQRWEDKRRRLVRDRAQRLRHND